MIVALPRHLDRGGMYAFLAEVIDHNANPRSKEIIFDFSTLEFIEPVGVTVLNNLIGRLQKNSVAVFFRSHKPNRSNKWCPIAYLDDSMFFIQHLNSTLDTNASLRQTTLPLENVYYSRSLVYLDNTMHWLANKLRLKKSSLGNIEMCLKEVFNNINDHSYEDSGSVFVQQYPNKNTVTIAISDFGVGIPYNVQQDRPWLNDAESIALAIEEGFTTKSSPGNRGAGLDLLLHNVVKSNQGSVYIHSNRGILNCIYDGNGSINIEAENINGYYPGTLLEITSRTDTIERVDEEEFSWL